MQMAVDVAGFTAAKADQLRQAMGAKRSSERMERLRGRLYAGMAERGIEGGGRPDLREAGRLRQLRLPREPLGVVRLPGLRQRLAEAPLPGGVPGRPAQRPADGLLVAQHLVADARRHGVVVRGPDVNPLGGHRHPRGPGAEGPAVRLGLGTCGRSGEELAEQVAEGRPYATMADPGAADRGGGGAGGGAFSHRPGAFGSLGLGSEAAL